LFVPTTPDRLRRARTCYDHMAGTVAVGMHDYMVKHGWLERIVQEDSDYRLSAGGAAASPAPAWTGASAARTSAAPSAPAC
jgi:hypothetical protein